MKTSNLIGILIIVGLIALPARYSYFEIDVDKPAMSLIGFLLIIIGVLAVFLVDMRSDKS